LNWPKQWRRLNKAGKEAADCNVAKDGFGAKNCALVKTGLSARRGDPKNITDQ